MGCADEPQDDEFTDVYGMCLEKYMLAADYKCIYRKSSVHFEGEDTVVFDFCTIKSEALFKNMTGCSSAFVFAATSGKKVENLLNTLHETSAADGFITSCIASSGIEVWCDEICRTFSQNYSIKPRFSPGYGGVSLEYQKNIFEFLDATKLLGITLNSSFIMTPIKSVTAFVGIKD